MMLGTVTVLASYGFHVNWAQIILRLVATYTTHCKGYASIFIQILDVEKIVILNAFCSKSSHDTTWALCALVLLIQTDVSKTAYLSPSPITIRKSSGLRSCTFCAGEDRGVKNGHLMSKGTCAVPLKTVLFGSFFRFAMVAVMTVGIKSTEYR